MNLELLRLLADLSVEGFDSAVAWRRVVMMHNIEYVRSDSIEDSKGFKLLLLDNKGAPAWFGRCACAETTTLRRETEILEMLSRASLGSHVPEVRAGAAQSIYVQLTRHLGECTYQRRIDRVAAGRWGLDVREILTLTEQLMKEACCRVSFLRDPPALATRQAGMSSDLKTLALAGLMREELTQIERALEVTETLPSVLQHGDLWPRNVLRAKERWWIIDYAECGSVWVPAYDLYHMLSNCGGAGTAPWFPVANGENGDQWSQMRMELICWFTQRHGLSSRDMGAALVYYLSHLAAYRLRLGAPAAYRDYLLKDLVRVAKVLAGGGCLDQLVAQS